MPRTVPFLWYDDQAEEAAQLYTSVFPNSKVDDVSRYGPGSPLEGKVMTVSFSLDGVDYIAINGGPMHAGFTEAISFMIQCADQAESDRFWYALTENGGEEGQCGWLKDRFGLSWQVAPAGLQELLGDPDPGRASRALQSMLQMKRLDLDAMRAAADGA